jgi:hypothetical protein
MFAGYLEPRKKARIVTGGRDVEKNAKMRRVS